MNKMVHLLQKISEIMANNGQANRAALLTKCFTKLQNNQELINDPNFIREIMNLYGGMGSFFDVVLYKDGKPLIQENNKLSRLTSELYDFCIELRTSRNHKN